jgi:hypothetical protein
MPGGYVVRDANDQALAYVYGRANEAEANWARLGRPWTVGRRAAERGRRACVSASQSFLHWRGSLSRRDAFRGYHEPIGWLDHLSTKPSRPPDKPMTLVEAVRFVEADDDGVPRTLI